MDRYGDVRRPWRRDQKQTLMTLLIIYVRAGDSKAAGGPSGSDLMTGLISEAVADARVSWLPESRLAACPQPVVRRPFPSLVDRLVAVVKEVSVALCMFIRVAGPGAVIAVDQTVHAVCPRRLAAARRAVRSLRASNRAAPD